MYPLVVGFVTFVEHFNWTCFVGPPVGSASGMANYWCTSFLVDSKLHLAGNVDLAEVNLEEWCISARRKGDVRTLSLKKQ